MDNESSLNTQEGTNNSTANVGLNGEESKSGVSEENAANLQKPARVIGKPFKKGVDERRNTTGQKKPTIWDYLEDGEDKTKIRQFINDPTKIKEVAEYILGKPQQSMDVTSGGEKVENITQINYIVPNGNDNSTPDEKTARSVSGAE